MKLLSLQFENVRNFTNATLVLDRDRILLVGRNNAGKTAALSFLDWIFNTLDLDELIDGEDGKHDCKELVLPAQSTGRRARRITLRVAIPDGRSHSKFQVGADGIATLRLRVGSLNNFRIAAKLGPPRKSEGWDTEPAAHELLVRLRDTYRVTYVPSFRDARSGRFRESLDSALTQSLSERALGSGKQGRQPRESKEIKNVKAVLDELARVLSQPVADQLEKGTPADLLQRVKLTIDAQPEDIVAFLVSQLEVRLVTGDHDSATVPTRAVGSGLQSALDVGLHSVRAPDDDRHHVLMVEEPEAFLHPSAQRLMARDLFRLDSADSLIVTTHSKIFVEEAGFTPLLLVSDQKLYAHGAISEADAAVYSSRLRSGGAEMIFAGSVLLVEGPGDVMFYEALRRRLAVLDPSGSLDRAHVVSVGGKTAFAPWVRLLRSFKNAEGERPITHLIVADADAAGDVSEATKASMLTGLRRFNDLTSAMKMAEADIKSASANDKKARTRDWHGKTRTANTQALQRRGGFPVLFHVGDLEYSALSSIGSETLSQLQVAFGTELPDRNAFLRKIGSKGVNGKASKASIKKPYLRGYMGDVLPRAEITDNTLDILRRWLSPVTDRASLTELLKKNW